MSFTRMLQLLKVSKGAANYELYDKYLALAMKNGREEIYKFISVNVKKNGLMTIYTIKINHKNL